MEEGGLTQEEIDALLVVDDDLLEEESHSLDDSEKDKATQLFQKAIKAGCETLGTMVGAEAHPEHLTVEATTSQSVADRFDETFGAVLCSLDVDGKSFGHLMAFPMAEAIYFSNQMVNPGGDLPADLSDMGQSAFESLMETFNGTVANTLAAETKKKVGAGGPKYLKGSMAELSGELEKIAGDDTLTLVQYDLVVPGRETSRVMSVVATKAVKQLTETGPIEPPAAKPAPAAEAAAAPAPAGGGGLSISAPVATIALPPGVDENLGRLLDIPLKVTVVLGKTKLEIEKVMDLGAGSIVELDQVHGEPVSILVNGRLFAKGEVVVVEENFGVRISHIITPEERLSLLQ